MKKLTFILFTFLFLLSNAQATTLETLFEDNFYTLHVQGRCGQNIMNFLQLAKKENLDLSGAEIIRVENGWVEPLYVRNSGYKPKVPGPAGIVYPAGPKYFDFHVFLVHENKVYDFDYVNKPAVHTVAKYMKKMWIRGKESDKYLGLRIFKAEDYLTGRSMPTNAPYQSLLQFNAERSKR